MRLSNNSIDRVASVFDGVELGDPRRAERLRQTVRQLARDPGATLPEAMGSEATLEGAYRFMNSGHVQMEALNEAHAQATATRARSAGKVLAIHDTTECAFAHADASEVGYLNTGKAGFRVHYTLVVDANGTRQPLGVANVEALFRAKPPRRRKAKGRGSPKVSGAMTIRKENRESLRWSRGFERTSECLEGSEVVHLADREGDSYELFARCVQRQLRFVIRVRVTGRKAQTEDGEEGTLQSLVENCKGVLSREVALSTRKPRSVPMAAKAHPPRAARVAHLEFFATTVEIARPRYHDTSLPSDLRLNLVRVFEPNPPPGEEGVEWLLFTNESVALPADVATIVDMYRTRWLIEECNKALKTGCQYEERQFESRAALLTLLAITLPIACELLWLRSRAREQPKRPASDVLSPLQLEILRILGSRKLPKTPTVHDALWAVAALGGHCKSNGEPGWLILHRGMTTLAAYEKGWRAARSSPRSAR